MLQGIRRQSPDYELPFNVGLDFQVFEMRTARRPRSSEPLNRRPPNSTAGTPQSRTATKLRGWLKQYWMPTLVAGFVLLNLAAFGGATLWGEWSQPEEPAVEISLGKFQYQSLESAAAIHRATFQLHVSLLTPRAPARYVLESRRRKVQQEVEQTLRLADPQVFVDPRLLELRRQLQEAINAALGRRLIEEVIVTELEVQ